MSLSAKEPRIARLEEYVFAVPYHLNRNRLSGKRNGKRSDFFEGNVLRDSVVRRDDDGWSTGRSDEWAEGMTDHCRDPRGRGVRGFVSHDADKLHSAHRASRHFRPRMQCRHTLMPADRMTAIALLCRTTPGRIV